jgi:hypothetical protein
MDCLGKLSYYCEQPKGLPLGSIILISKGQIKTRLKQINGHISNAYDIGYGRIWESDCFGNLSRSSDPKKFNAITKFDTILSKKTRKIETLTLVVETLRDIMYNEEICVCCDQTLRYISKARTNLDNVYPDWHGPFLLGDTESNIFY